jgi:hypothetical protein
MGVPEGKERKMKKYYLKKECSDSPNLGMKWTFTFNKSKELHLRRTLRYLRYTKINHDQIVKTKDKEKYSKGKVKSNSSCIKETT